MTRWFRAILIVAILAGQTTAAVAAPTVETSAQALFAAAHVQVGGGTTFTAATCAQAAPLLDRGLELANADPNLSSNGFIVYPLIERATCMLVSGTEDEAALAMFRRAIAIGQTPTGGPTLVSMARACLAYMADRGRGMPVDPERALGLYLLSEGTQCRGIGHDAPRAAAEILQKLDPLAGMRGSIYYLLKQGSSRDLLLAVNLFEKNFAGAGLQPDLFAMAVAGLDAGGAALEDVAARATLNLKLATWHKAQSRYAVALAYFLAAEPSAARVPLAAFVRDHVPYRLVLENGQPWVAPHDH
jgi:hypothetical protein